MTSTESFAEGQTVTVIASPGYPTEFIASVLIATPRCITTVHESGLIEEFTLRRNGKYALRGGSQWSNYLKAA